VVDLGQLTLSGVVAWSFWGAVHLFVTVVSANRFKQSLLPTSHQQTWTSTPAWILLRSPQRDLHDWLGHTSPAWTPH
jgi:hypothetical protein